MTTGTPPPDDGRHRAALGRILELALLLNGDMTRSLARDGLTVSRTRVLWELRGRGPITQRDLAESLQVSARTVTGLIDGLAGSGFVTREPHPTDRRATLVTLTAHGVETVAGLERGEGEFAHLLFAGMPAERFDCFVAGLDTVLDRLRAQGLSAELEADGR